MKTKAKQTASRVLTYADAARMLGCKRATVHRVVARGDLKRALTGRRLGGNGHREIGVTRASVERLLAWRKRGGISPLRQVRGKSGSGRPVVMTVRRESAGAGGRIIRITIEVPDGRD
jgi:predicted DNA-binding transcriptional regulator AlpA